MISQSFDVVIAGGGPAGSTLGALLRKRSSLDVLIVDEAVHPREHIGESLVHALMPFLEETGALPKVLASPCWVKKFGGIFAWDRQRPAVTFFDHVNWREDGVHRWAVHVNRSEFDHILLENAVSLGCTSWTGVAVRSYAGAGDGSGGVVTLADGRQLCCRLFVDASGRHDGIVAQGRRSYLSRYKNLAVWNHFLGCTQAHRLPHDWNIFREQALSPIACFAFEHGWVWYIPVPKVITGERVLTHSIGLVSDPEIVKRRETNFLDVEVFLRQMKQVPLLSELIADARPVSDQMLVTSNYSMISESFCNRADSWILVGDAAYFVDPLFSSGVTFAAAMASGADLLIRSALGEDGPGDAELGDMWHDYDAEWQQIAHSFALAIDQWYHAIAENHPRSIYWKVRAEQNSDLGIRGDTFQALIDTAITPDLLQVMTSGSLRMADLSQAGPFMKSLGTLARIEPAEDDLLRLAPGLRLRQGASVDVPGFKASIPPDFLPPEIKAAIAEYWRRLPEPLPGMPSPNAEPATYGRVWAVERPQAAIRFFDPFEGGSALVAALEGRQVRYGELKRSLAPPTLRLLKRMIAGEMVEVRAAAEAGRV
jgi:flavin-dependent dehydrogenase